MKKMDEIVAEIVNKRLDNAEKDIVAFLLTRKNIETIRSVTLKDEAERELSSRLAKRYGQTKEVIEGIIEAYKIIPEKTSC